MDPNTGLPERPPWKDPSWPEPTKVLPDVYYDGLPVSEIANLLRNEFKGAFDIVIPPGWQNPSGQDNHFEPGSVPVKLRLKDVTASEIFNAMNILFETENAPVRWELTMNGRRPIAVLHIVPHLIPAEFVPPEQRTPMKRLIYFVGDMLDDSAGNTMTMDSLVKTLTEVYEMSHGTAHPKNFLKFHKEAQLLIVNGTPEQISFVQDTLQALRSKSNLDRRRNIVRKRPADEKGDPKDQ
ncbi:MAG TPA: hypothetical protein VGE41_02690 [Verrucomicrobiae bacterium]